MKPIFPLFFSSTNFHLLMSHSISETRVKAGDEALSWASGLFPERPSLTDVNRWPSPILRGHGRCLSSWLAWLGVGDSENTGVDLTEAAGGGRILKEKTHQYSRQRPIHVSCGIK